MCRSRGEGGRRCGVNHERGNAQKRAAYAAGRVEAAAVGLLPAPPAVYPPQGDRENQGPVAIEEVAERAAEVRGWAKRAGSLASVDEEGNATVTRECVELEAAATEVGRALAVHVEEEFEARWREALAGEYADLSEERLKECEAAVAAAWEEYEAYGETVDPDVGEPEASNWERRQEELEEVWSRADDTLTSLRTREKIVRAAFRAEAVRTVMNRVRPMGGALELGASSGDDEESHRFAVMLVEDAARYLPADWVRESNEYRVPLHIILGKGVVDRAFFVVAAVPGSGESETGIDSYELPGEESARSLSAFTEEGVMAPDGAVSLLFVPRRRPAVGVSGEAVHELTHRMSQTRLGGQVLPAVQEAFLLRRTTDAEGNRLPAVSYGASLGSLAKLAGASEEEQVIPDEFVDIYIGKQYPHLMDREVLTMGIQALLDGSYGGLRGRDGFRADPDHEAFTLGVFACL